jgi:hypothetical protein
MTPSVLRAGNVIHGEISGSPMPRHACTNTYTDRPRTAAALGHTTTEEVLEGKEERTHFSGLIRVYYWG